MTIKIKILIHTTIAKRDRSGNCYTFSTVTNVRTGKFIRINDGWGSDGRNVESQVRKLLEMDYQNIRSTEEIVGIRDFNLYVKHYEQNGMIHSHDLTAAMLKKLNRKDKAVK